MVMSIAPVGACDTFSVVVAMKLKGDWRLLVKLASTCFAFGSRTTSPVRRQSSEAQPAF